MVKVYVAGFDVFAADSVERKRRAEELLERHGFACLHPLDNDATTAQDIYEGNIRMIRDCDLVVANLNPFRGPCEPDAGTSFEVGFATALGKPVWAYADDVAPMRQRMGAVDERGFRVEDFGAPMNLMLASSVHLVRGSLEDCLRELAEERGAGC